MSSEIISTLITVGGTILALLLNHWLQAPSKSRRSKKENAPPVVSVPETPSLSDKGHPPIRYLDQPHQVRFVGSLPELKKVIFQNARQGWDSGITANMAQANADVIDFLVDVWVKLSGFYPERHFDGKTGREFISDYIKSRFDYHNAKHEPTGPGSHGTIVRVLVGGDVIHDLDQMVVDMVSTLAVDAKTIDSRTWKAAWGAAS